MPPLYAGVFLLASTLAGLPAAVSADTRVALTAPEKQMILEHPVIRMCIDPVAMPYEMLDEDGRHIGMVPEYIKMMAQRTGLNIELVPTANWSETLQFVREHKCDIVSALNETEDRKSYLLFTEPYIKAWAALAVRNDGSDTIWGLEYMSGKKLAVVKDDFHEEVVSRHYPDIELVYVADMTDGLQQVSGGEADAVIGPLLMIAYHLRKLDLDNLEIMGRTRYENLLRIGVRQDNPAPLVSVFNKAIETLTPEDDLRIRRDVFK